jgi:rfaE bifunctional protein kinase chain/domain
VAVVGDVMLDVYLVGAVSRISPEAPVPVVHVTEERVALGGAANVAANVAALGAECHLVGYVGATTRAMQIRDALAALEGGSVHPRWWSAPHRPTTTKTRVVARHQQVVRFDREHDDDVGRRLRRRAVRRTSARRWRRATRWCWRTTTRACWCRR